MEGVRARDLRASENQAVCNSALRNILLVFVVVVVVVVVFRFPF